MPGLVNLQLRALCLIMRMQYTVDVIDQSDFNYEWLKKLWIGSHMQIEIFFLINDYYQ